MLTSEIRKEARESLKGKWGKAVCIALAFIAISMVIGFIQGFVGEESTIYNIIEIAYLIISIPLSFGLLISFIKLKRGEDISAFAFFKEGFSRFGKSWGVWFHTFIRLLLPMVCLFLTVLLIVMLGVVNIFAETNTILIILGVVLLLVTVVYAASRAFLYVIAYNISYDNPELSSKECVLKSAKLMKGNRGNYFLLELSFIGWAILAAFTLGIGMLWLMPYMQVAVICFYEKVLKGKETEKVEEAVKIEE